MMIIVQQNMGCTVKMNKINDRDLTELSSYWVYQNIDMAVCQQKNENFLIFFNKYY